MKRRSRPVDQFFWHEIEDEDKAQSYLNDALPLIGHIVMHFNGLEADLNRLICGYISDRSDEKGLIVLHRMQYAAKLELFERFTDDYHRVASLKIPQYDGLAEKLREGGRLRNMVVHADWEATEDDGYTFVRVKITESGLEQEYVQLSGESLEQVFKTIMETRRLLDEYVMAVEEEEQKRFQATEFSQPLLPRS